MQLKYDLERNVNLVKFSNGQIEFSLNENINKDFIKHLSQKLFNWTGKRWIITLSKIKDRPTYQEIEFKKIRAKSGLQSFTSFFKAITEIRSKKRNKR